MAVDVGSTLAVAKSHRSCRRHPSFPPRDVLCRRLVLRLRSAPQASLYQTMLASEFLCAVFFTSVFA